jgi:hypothetical protein
LPFCHFVLFLPFFILVPSQIIPTDITQFFSAACSSRAIGEREVNEREHMVRDYFDYIEAR